MGQTNVHMITECAGMPDMSLVCIFALRPPGQMVCAALIIAWQGGI